MPLKRRIVIGMSGASGQIYGIRLLKALSTVTDVETHLVLSNWGKETICNETGYDISQVAALANYCHDISDLTAPIASGSFRWQTMIVIPCSIKTLSAISNSYDDNLLVRAADVTLKERRRLILVVRETPLHTGHLKLMLNVAEMGAVIMPPVPNFYSKPKNLNDLIDQLIGRLLDMSGIENELSPRWKE